MQIEGVKRTAGKQRDKVQTDSVKRGNEYRKTQALILTKLSRYRSPPLLCCAPPAGELPGQLARALAVSAAALSPGQVEGARARLAAAARLRVVRVEAAGRWRAGEAGR